MDTPLVKDIWPRSAAFMDQHLRRMTSYAWTMTKCKRKGVACTAHRFSDRSYCFTTINGPIPGHKCTGVKGACGCEHAEIRALDSILEEPVILCVTFSCCQPCAEAIVKSGMVAAVCYRILAEHHGESVNDYLRANGVQVYKFEQQEEDVDV